MATFVGEGRRKLEQARRARDPKQKLRLMEDALDETLRELEYVLNHLGKENFAPEGRKEEG